MKTKFDIKKLVHSPHQPSRKHLTSSQSTSLLGILKLSRL
ncbi:unnamed protein product [Paramecium octaurelia]|uniref:Uncharacterized protein n=1 Tax=Paramecium octaurelia TaxID=43137 RepID=A0A8S1YCW5_PAROT|nr:unnamed protein product [Paramecium octaurelia]